MNKNNKQSDREILEEILKILRNFSVSPIVVHDPMKLYNNKELMEKLGVKDKYLKKLRDNGFLGYSREGDKYWYTQKDVDCFLRSFHYEPFNPNRSLGPISSGDVKVFSCSPESKECLPLIHGSHET